MATPPSSKIQSLEGLRGLCALLVVVGHIHLPPQAQSFAAAHPFFETVAMTFAGLGGPAVLVFFVLSGYVMAHRYPAPLDGPALREYLWRRWLRIWPIMLVAIALAVAAARGASPVVVLGHLLFLQGFLVPTLPGDVPLWTLTYEVIYYLLFGLMMRGILPRATMPVLAVLGSVAAWFSPATIFHLLALALLWWAGSWLARSEGNSRWLVAVTDGNSALRSVGLLVLVLAYHFGGILNPAARLAGASQSMLINDLVGAPLYLAIVCETLGVRFIRVRWLWILVVLACLPRLLYQWPEIDPGVIFRRSVYLGQLGLSLGLLLASLGRWPWLRLGSLAPLGAISYALYLLHWPVMQIAWSLTDTLSAPAQKALLVLSGYLLLFPGSWVMEKYYQKAWNRAFSRLISAKSAAQAKSLS